MCRALECGAHSPTKLRAVDLGLRLDGQAGLDELLFGPHGFGGRTHLGSFDRDRGLRVELGAFAFGTGFGVAVMGRFTAPQSQDQRQQAEQDEERDRERAAT